MPRRDFDEGNWTAYLQRAARLRPRNCGPVNGGEVAAGIISKIGKGEYVHEQDAEVTSFSCFIFGKGGEREREWLGQLEKCHVCCLPIICFARWFSYELRFNCEMPSSMAITCELPEQSAKDNKIYRFPCGTHEDSHL